MAEGGLLAALSPRGPIPETNGDTPVARGELWRGELLALSLPRPVGNGYVSSLLNMEQICPFSLHTDWIMFKFCCYCFFCAAVKRNVTVHLESCASIVHA